MLQPEMVIIGQFIGSRGGSLEAGLSGNFVGFHTLDRAYLDMRAS